MGSRAGAADGRSADGRLPKGTRLGATPRLALDVLSRLEWTVVTAARGVTDCAETGGLVASAVFGLSPPRLGDAYVCIAL